MSECAATETIIVEGLTNEEFFEQYAAPGRIGLYGGPELINRMIMRAQRHLNDESAWSRWSHAFLLQGRRLDGHHWVIESDLDIHRKHIRLGVQENRISKYLDDARTSALAILDFNLNDDQLQRVLASALEHVAGRTQYSLGELAGAALAMRRKKQAAEGNVLARDHAYFCSAFVRDVFTAAGIDLVPGVDVKLTAPEHIAKTQVPHRKWLLLRAVERKGKRLAARVKSRIKEAGARVKARLRSQ